MWLKKKHLVFGNKFFETMNEQDQQSFFLAIFDLPLLYIKLGYSYKELEVIATIEKPEITICTVALLNALCSVRHEFLKKGFARYLTVSNFALSSQADVQTMSNFILANPNLQMLELKRIECPIVYNKQDDDGPIGFLAPLLHASSHL